MVGLAQQCKILLESVPRFERRIFGDIPKNEARKVIPRSRSDSHLYEYNPYVKYSSNIGILTTLHVELLQGQGCESYPYLEMDETCMLYYS